MLGIIIEFVARMGAILHGVCHTHSHGGVTATTTSDNINVRAAAAHVLGDLLQSFGVLIAATVVKVCTVNVIWRSHTLFRFLDISRRSGSRSYLYVIFFCDYYFYYCPSGARFSVVANARQSHR